MKHLLIVLLLIISFGATAQPARRLEKPAADGPIPVGQAVFYGEFVQRLKKFKSGGYPQDIRLINIETNEVLVFRVKSTFKTSKENRFCYLIEPGDVCYPELLVDRKQMVWRPFLYGTYL